MKKQDLHNIIREQLSKTLNEDYVDKFKFKGILTTNTTIRPQQEILSDIRALTGVTIVSTVDLDGKYSQENENLKVILNIKIDGYPFIRHGGFSREKINDIIASIRRVEGVKGLIVNPQNITQL
jgi:hypothetical protein